MKRWCKNTQPLWNLSLQAPRYDRMMYFNVSEVWLHDTTVRKHGSQDKLVAYIKVCHRRAIVLTVFPPFFLLHRERTQPVHQRNSGLQLLRAGLSSLQPRVHTLPPPSLFGSLLSGVCFLPFWFPDSSSPWFSLSESFHALHSSNFPPQAVLGEIAAGLGVDVQDLDFAGMTFYQGSEFPIEKEFDGGYVDLSSVRGKPWSWLEHPACLGGGGSVRSRGCRNQTVYIAQSTARGHTYIGPK